MSWDAMIRAEEARGLTDRIALSHELLELAARFEIEAGNWQHPAMAQTRTTLVSDGRMLEALGRAALDARSDERVSLAYRDAAHARLLDIIAKRRRLEQLRNLRASA